MSRHRAGCHGTDAGDQDPSRSAATATIQAIDSTTRAITLRDETGVEDTYVAGPEMKRFDELKVGDTVKMTYTESVVLQVRKAGGAAAGTTGAKPAASTLDAAVTRGKGALPGVTAAVQDKMTVTVKSIDRVPAVAHRHDT